MRILDCRFRIFYSALHILHSAIERPLKSLPPRTLDPLNPLNPTTNLKMIISLLFLNKGKSIPFWYSIISVMTFDPNPSLDIASRGLAFLIMSLHPVSPTITVTGDPDSLPCSWNPFPSNIPMAWNIFRWWRWRTVPRFWRRIINHLRWLGRMGVGIELIGHCS